MRYKLVTFDVTNTLLKLRSAPGEQYAKIGEIHGVRADPVKLTNSFNASWKRLNVEHPNYGRHTGLDSSERWWSLLIHQTFAGAGHLLDSVKVSAITSNLIDIYRTEACWTVKHGVPEVLKRIRSSDVTETVGVISNFDEHLDSVLHRTELSQYFDFVLSSYVANCYKPQSAIFELALRENGLRRCRPGEALHIGDDVQLDYVAARCAGWNSLLVASSSELKPEVDPSFLIEDIKDVVGFIDCKSDCLLL